MDVAITGARGFAGSSIVNDLKEQFKFKSISVEAMSAVSINRDYISETPVLIHLGAISSVGDCENNMPEAYKVNVGLTCALAEIYFNLNPGGHFIFASTGQVYDASQVCPHNEETMVAPSNIYARSKYCAELAVSAIAKQLNGRLTILRMYNFTHKTQSSRFVLPSAFKQLYESNSSIVNLKVGNIDVERDFSSIQDLISAFSLVIRSLPSSISPSIYNLSSGRAKSIRSIIQEFARRLEKKIIFDVDSKLVRSNDPPKIEGDCSKFKRDFHWETQSKSITEFVDLFLRDR